MMMTNSSTVDSAEHLARTWDTRGPEVVIVPLTASEYEALRQIGADSNEADAGPR